MNAMRGNHHKGIKIPTKSTIPPMPNVKPPRKGGEGGAEKGVDNFNIIYHILRHLEKAMDYDEVDMDSISAEKFHITEKHWIALMEMMLQERYIDGASVKRPADGETVLSISNLRITLKGMEYLRENSIMKKAANAANGIVDY